MAPTPTTAARLSAWLLRHAADDFVDSARYEAVRRTAQRLHDASALTADEQTLIADVLADPDDTLAPSPKTPRLDADD